MNKGTNIPFKGKPYNIPKKDVSRGNPLLSFEFPDVFDLLAFDDDDIPVSNVKVSVFDPPPNGISLYSDVIEIRTVQHTMMIGNEELTFDIIDFNPVEVV